jgi:hypothetical protein
MTAEEFDQTMRSFVKRRPFLPFVVELLDGERIVVANRHVAFGGGTAGFLSRKEGLVDFNHEQVRSFEFLPPAITNGQRHKIETDAITQSFGAEGKPMTEEAFDQTVRSFVKRRPFMPFVVELLDGRRIIVPHRHVAFGGGVAGFLSRKEGLVGFSKDDVRSFRHLSPETADDPKRV